MREYCAQFERDLESDNYTPITAKDEEAFRAVVTQFPFYRRGMDQVYVDMIIFLSLLIIIKLLLLKYFVSFPGALSSRVSVFEVRTSSIRSSEELPCWMFEIYGAPTTLSH